MSNATQDILVHAEGGVTAITFNRVERKNSFTEAMYAAMADVLEASVQDESVRCVVFQGDVTVFSAGNDIEDFLRQGSERAPSNLSERPVARFLKGIATFPKPLVAAVCGPAVGVGTTMLLHCDLVYAGDNAAFSLPFINLGLCPEAASSLLLPRMFGMHRAAEALMLGEPFMAEAALEVGFVNRVVPPTECNQLAQAQARKLAAKPLEALMETKRLMRAGQTERMLGVMADESQTFTRLMRGPAAREAFTAFLEKRKPDFSKC